MFSEVKIGNIIGFEGKPGKGIDDMPPVYFDTLITDKETLTNQWRDGKPVYQMLVDFGAVPYTANNGVTVFREVALAVPNIDFCWIVYGMTIDSAGAVGQIPGLVLSNVNSPANYVPRGITAYIKSSDGIKSIVISNSYVFVANAKVLVRYTKTTDVAIPPYQLPVPCFDIEEYGVEYRTMKRRNGKTVYKMLVDLGQLPQATSNGVYTEKEIILNIKNVETMDINGTIYDTVGVGNVTHKIPITSASPVNSPANYAPRLAYVYGRIKDTDTVSLYSVSSFTSFNIYYAIAILEYTKTIDTPETPGLMPAIVQESGNRTDVTMSQKAVSDMMLVLSPHLWPVGQEMAFPDDSFGKRYTGSVSLAANVVNQPVIDPSLTKTNAKNISYGGSCSAANGHPVPFYHTGHFHMLNLAATGLHFASLSVSAVTATYDVWIRYLKI